MKIARRFKFEAAHRLDHHDGKCRRLHGHTYHMELVFSGTIVPINPDEPQSGFLADFGRINRLVNAGLIDPYLDHHMLNERVPNLPYPSAEILALWILEWCENNLNNHEQLPGLTIERVRLWETPNAWAEAQRGDVALLDQLRNA
ncbi:MAG: 6-carboxytetrahydropterin synthase [Magnetococcales bacterium]|nr:6-carboxytetrahydropterin synthase [Magnetococcales bacterium]